MPQVFAIVAAVVAAVLPESTPFIVATIVTDVAIAGTLGAIGYLASAALSTASPSPEAMREVERQAIPPRRRACGECRLGGFYLIDLSDGQVLYRVVAFADSEPETILAYYLCQDEVRVVGGAVQKMTNGAYPDGKTRFETTFGVSGVVAFPALWAEQSSVWPGAYGTGIFMGYMRAANGDLKGYPTRFPRGKPIPNIAARIGPVFDWRDGSQNRATPASWKVSKNPVVNLVHELWCYRGYDWTTDFAPTLSILTDEAGVCDAPIEALNVLAKIVVDAPAGAAHVVIASGPTPPIGANFFLGGQTWVVSGVASYSSGGITGWTVSWSGSGLYSSVQIGSVARWQATVAHPVTEPTYACGGAWNVDEPEAQTVARFCDAMDGWMARRGLDGAVVIRAGHYYEPTVIIGADEVIGYTWQPFVESDKAVNQLIPSFVSAAYDYTQVDTTPWQDDADILVNGLSSQAFQPDMVQSNGQVRRLAKRKLTRLTTHSETLTLKASGLRALGERYIRVQLGGEEVDELEDVVLEIVGDYEIGDNGMSVTLQVAKADPNIDEWNAYTDEGSGPADASSPVQNELVAPTITDVTPIDELVGTGVDSVRLSIAVDPPADFATRDDLTWFAQWRVTGSDSWNTLTYSGLSDGSVLLNTGFVPIDQTLDVQAAYQTGGGNLSPFTGSWSVTTSTAMIAPSAPTGTAATSPGAGLADVAFRNPTSSNFDHGRVFRGTTAVFGSASDVSGAISGAPGANEIFHDTSLASGTYYYWSVAENASSAASPPDGPSSVAVA